jgi:hypothetical protein
MLGGMDKSLEKLRRHHAAFAANGEPFDEDWHHQYFENYSDDLDVEYSGETNSDNYASGDESETIYSQKHQDEQFFWICTSSGGFQGPYNNIDQAISALGYDPEKFDLC